jgi:predicted aldo/keto reductase-like oxidoreductase
MNNAPSRRNFLAAGLALPVAASATHSSGSGQSQSSPPARSSSGAALQYKTLGKTGLKVTTVGMGCMVTSDPTVVTRAADMGINYFDTSRGYQGGQNERMVGTALGAKRKNVFLSSKCDRRDGASILTELDTSLKELGTDYLDVWHLHGKSNPADISDDMVAAQQKAKQQGKVRFIGVSCHANLPAIVDRVIEAKLDVVQAQYSFAQDATWTPAVEKLAQAGVGVIAMKVMARAGGRGGAAQPKRPANFGASALRWVIKNPSVATTVPSMTDVDQLEENFTAMTAPFGDADAKILSARLEEIRPYYCRTCGQCDGQCPKGLPVPEMVRYVMYADGYGQFPLGRENFQRMAQEHQDVRCGDCAECAVQCPHGVHVAQQLRRAQELFA